MTISENKNRLDNHSDRIRALEARLGRNNIVGEAMCRERHIALESRMNKAERKIASMDVRLWGLLVIALVTLAKVAWG